MPRLSEFSKICSRIPLRGQLASPMGARPAVAFILWPSYLVKVAGDVVASTPDERCSGFKFHGRRTWLFFSSRVALLYLIAAFSLFQHSCGATVCPRSDRRPWNVPLFRRAESQVFSFRSVFLVFFVQHFYSRFLVYVFSVSMFHILVFVHAIAFSDFLGP